MGGDLGAQILALVPPAFQDAVRPLVPAIVNGIHEAFSLASGAAFQIGVVTTIGALVAAFALRELPLRTGIGEGPLPTPEAGREPSTRLTGAPAAD